MILDRQTPLILSASRTKDMVHRAPDLLADILLGKAPCRWGPHGPFGRVDPSALHSVVLWTKDPTHLLTHGKLRDALQELRVKHQVQIALQLTATSLGGSFIEPGIPHWKAVHAQLARLLAEGWISAEAVLFRYDPFIRIRTPAGRICSNADVDIFRRISAEFLRLGVCRITTSRGDAVRYPKVSDRIRKFDLTWIHIPDEEAADLCVAMAELVRSRGGDFSICCEPYIPELVENWGCIDARRLNRIKGANAEPAAEILHNRIGRQRPSCQCTYSRDIGYSTGSANCYSGGFGCLYCYSQGNAQFPNSDSICADIAEFDRNPGHYLEKRDLPLELCPA
jgi:hypothetical protein